MGRRSKTKSCCHRFCCWRDESILLISRTYFFHVSSSVSPLHTRCIRGTWQIQSKRNRAGLTILSTSTSTRSKQTRPRQRPKIGTNLNPRARSSNAWRTLNKTAFLHVGIPSGSPLRGACGARGCKTPGCLGNSRRQPGATTLPVSGVPGSSLKRVTVSQSHVVLIPAEETLSVTQNKWT